MRLYTYKKLLAKLAPDTYPPGALKPYGYTRIGPALRHAAALMAQQNHQKKWILLLQTASLTTTIVTREYGIQDAKQSIKEASQKDVNIYALAIEGSAKQYFPYMFAKNRFRICTHPRHLPKAMLNFFLLLAL